MKTAMQRAEELCDGLSAALPLDASKAALALVKEQFGLLYAVEQGHLWAAWRASGNKEYAAFKRWYEKNYEIPILVTPK